tara:strand:- start:350 stop:628 length:279 start_codon:yes stop_codon:yes gene_type:complete
MSNIFSNRFVQGGIAIAIVAIAFFAYQNTGDSVAETAAVENTEESSTTESASANATTTTEDATIKNDQIENAVNNTTESDNITNSEDDAATE